LQLVICEKQCVAKSCSFFFFFLAVPGIEPRAFNMVSKLFTAEL
jgi:hypothetical protein